MSGIQNFGWELLQNIVPGVITLVVGVLGVLATYLTTKLSKFLESKSKQAEDVSKQNFVSNTLGRFEQLVVSVVASLNQTVVNDLKAATEDGKLTKEEAQNVLGQAIDRIKAQTTTEMAQVLQETYVDVDAYILDLVEQTVSNLKK